MITFKSFLTEAFNSPYKYKWHLEDSHEWIGEFQAKSDLMEVTLDRYQNEWELGFGCPENPAYYKSTGSFDAFKVLSTIVAMVEDFIESVNPNKIVFIGNKEEGKADLYKMMLKKFKNDLKSLDYKVTSSENAKGTEFKIVKDK